MRRLVRLLFDAIAAIALLLAVGVAGLWTRSVWTNDELEHGHAGERYVAVASERGRLYATTATPCPEPRPFRWEAGRQYD